MDTSLNIQGKEIVTLPLEPGNSKYKIFVNSLEFLGNYIPISNSFLFDSGTTFSYLTENVYKEFIKIFKKYSNDFPFPQINQSNDICFIIHQNQNLSLDQQLEIFPILRFNLRSNFIEWEPINYLIQSTQNDEEFCLGIQSYDSNIFGGNFMKNYQFVIDISNWKISYSKANCSGNDYIIEKNNEMPINQNPNDEKEQEKNINFEFENENENNPLEHMYLIVKIFLLILIISILIFFLILIIKTIKRRSRKVIFTPSNEIQQPPKNTINAGFSFVPEKNSDSFIKNSSRDSNSIRSDVEKGAYLSNPIQISDSVEKTNKIYDSPQQDEIKNEKKDEGVLK